MPKHILVVGAGITGLTVAHELMQRGFRVTVVEQARLKKVDEAYVLPAYPALAENQNAARAATCDVGGMARTQWCEIFTEVKPDLKGPIPGPSPKSLREYDIAFQSDSVVPVDEAACGKAIQDAVNVLQGDPVAVMGIYAANTPYGKKIIDWLGQQLDAKIQPSRWQSNLTTGALPNKAMMRIPFATVPGEHGFRFFPAFYRHLFDTMQRTPIPASTRPVNDFAETVYDNLVSTQTLQIGLLERESFSVNREPRSLKALRKILHDVLSRLRWSPQDVARLELKMFKYMTSSKKRREDEYENISWSDFIEQERYSKACQEDLEWSPQTLGALRGSKSDCRTQGDMSVQLLLEQVSAGPRFDSLLNGPTSVAWLRHWRAFLEEGSVEFVLGKLVGFESRGEKVVPVVKPVDDKGETGAGPIPELDGMDGYVLALDLPSLRDLVDEFVEAATAANAANANEETLADYGRVKALLPGDWRKRLNVPAPVGPLQHLSGVQFYFVGDASIRLAEGHTLYMDAPWGLTSITQSLFWQGGAPSDSVISVDIATWNRQYPDKDGKNAWDCDASTLANTIWQQIAKAQTTGDTLGGLPTPVKATETGVAAIGKIELPLPSAYHVDENLVFEGGRVKENKTPFLVNRVGEFPRRPGRLVHQGQVDPGYQVCLNGWVLAGTYMQTHTRITTMEAANESGRHAVNGLLTHLGYTGERCQIWDPEDHEVDDLDVLKEVDRKLMKREKPHFVDILGWECLDEELLPSSLDGLFDDQDEPKGKAPSCP
ncbi:MAG TPA: FAD-dependent oxidoreductase [Polyangiaceae bacterium]|jgi:hypothetical protein